MQKIPVVILNGFLGSGKTTLLRNLLSQSRRKNISVCTVVNDMSELDVDGELIASSEAVENNSDISESISSCFKLTVIGDKKHVTKFTEKLKTCFLSENEIKKWRNGFRFEDPWPKNILRI